MVRNPFVGGVERQGSIIPVKGCVEPGAHGPRHQEGWMGLDGVGFQAALQGRPVSQSPVGRERAIMKEGSVEMAKDGDVVRPHRGERIRTFREIGY